MLSTWTHIERDPGNQRNINFTLKYSQQRTGQTSFHASPYPTLIFTVTVYIPQGFQFRKVTLRVPARKHVAKASFQSKARVNESSYKPRCQMPKLHPQFPFYCDPRHHTRPPASIKILEPVSSWPMENKHLVVRHALPAPPPAPSQRALNLPLTSKSPPLPTVPVHNLAHHHYPARP